MRRKTSNVLTIVLLIVVIIMAMGFFSVVKKNNSNEVIALKYTGKTLLSGESLGLLNSGSEFEVEGAQDYTIAVSAYSSEEDFSFNIGAEQYVWSEIKDRDFTDVFTIIKTDNGFILNFENFETIMEKSFNLPINANSVPDFDIFKLTVNDVSITFLVSFEETTDDIPPGEIMLNPDSIVF